MVDIDHTQPAAGEDDHSTRLVGRLAELGVRVESLRETPAWKSWLSAAGKFRQYSFGNQLLIAMQKPDATRVAGFVKWKELGRQVRKGEKGIVIIRPRLGRKDELGQRHIIGFGTAHVFDISQTEGQALPVQPAWPMVMGEPSITFEDIAQMAAAVSGLSVSRPENVLTYNPMARGWFVLDTKEIFVRAEMVPDSLVEQFMGDGRPYYVDTETGELWDESVQILEPAQQVHTLLHELGHAHDPELRQWMSEDRASCELVAESAAWIVGEQMGLECSDEVEHYLASFHATPERLVWVGRRVTKAVASIEAMLATSIDVQMKEAA